MSIESYNPAQCLREEVDRFKATNTFTPMLVTGFYLQAAVVLNEHRDMVQALRTIRNMAIDALPISERTQL